MPEREQTTANLIAQLAAEDARLREKAAGEIFRRGCAAAEPVLRNWFADPDFRALVPGGPGLLTVGIAVEPSRFAELHRRFGAPRLAEVPPDQDAREFELKFAHGVQLDILTTRDASGSGAIARFLARFGEAVQQVECAVRDASRAAQILRNHFALTPVYAETRDGADGTHVNFILVPVAENRKVLIELVEAARKEKPR